MKNGIERVVNGLPEDNLGVLASLRETKTLVFDWENINSRQDAMSPVRIGRSEVSERELFSLALPDFQSLPDSISLPSRHFIAFLAADATGIDSAVLSECSRRLLQAGCVCFCAWGADCERVHDVFDLECLDTEPLIMTNWHSEESLDEALWFFVYTAFSDDGYEDTTRSGLAISIGRPDWAEHIRMRLADLDSLTRDVVDET
jgi:hypothetical protein